jgi:hypothetical protein
VLHVLSARARVALGLLAVTLPLAGCAGFDDPAAAQGVTRTDLVAELAGQLAASASLTYTATYQLAGGGTGSIARAQDPARSAYRYSGGVVLITTAATTRCTKATCTMTPSPAPSERPPATLFADAQRHGLVTPATVLALLTAAALDPDPAVEQHDTTIAGRHATCVELKDAATAEFSTCITNDGVLGSFTGRLSGTDVDMAMTNYAERVGAETFAPPPGAKLVDRR